MKIIMYSIDCCNDCPFCLHEEFGYTRCQYTEKVVRSTEIDNECPLPEFDEVTTGSDESNII